MIWFFSLFFLMSLANGLSIYFSLIFSKYQLLVLLIFVVVSFVYSSFISALIFMIYFLLLALGFFISSLLIVLGVKLGYLFDFTPISWSKLLLLWTFPSTESHRFWTVVFSFSFLSMQSLIYFLISSVICWLFRSVLFSLHMFEFLIIFFPIIEI